MKKLSMALAVIICAMLLLTGCDVAGATGGLINFENIANNLEGIGELLESIGDISSLLDDFNNNGNGAMDTIPGIMDGESWESAILTETVRPEYPDGPDFPDYDGVDYGGREFKIIFANENNGWASMGYDEGSVINSYVYDRNVAIEERLNISISNECIYESYVGEKNLLNHVQTLCMAGLPADLVVGQTSTVQTLALNGYMGNWNNTGVDLNAQWWYQDAKDQFTTEGGRLYSLAGDGSHAILANTLVTFVNRDFFEMYGFSTDNIYNEVRCGNWSYEILYQYSQKVSKDVNGDGVLGDGDHVGYYISSASANAVIAATGEHLLENNGGWGFNGNIGRLNDICEYVCNKDWSYSLISKEEFMNGNVLFLTERLEYAEELWNNGINYAVVPTPNYQGNSYSSLVSISAPVIGYCSDVDAELVADVVDLMGYYGSNQTLSEYLFVVAPRSDDFEMMEIVRSTMFFDHEYLMASSGNLYSQLSNMIMNKENNVMATIKAYQAKVENEVINWSGGLDKLPY